jgi:hypothetical protein
VIIHGIRSLLLNQPSILLALPNQTIRRISVPAVFCDSAIQGFAPPYAVLSDLGTEPNLYLAEPVSGFRTLELDIDVYSYDEPRGRAAMKTIREFFDDYSGTAGDERVLAVLWQDEAYRYTRVGEGRDTRFHVSTTSYLVQYQ